jgi:hypothetical protein
MIELGAFAGPHLLLDRLRRGATMSTQTKVKKTVRELTHLRAARTGKSLDRCGRFERCGRWSRCGR